MATDDGTSTSELAHRNPIRVTRHVSVAIVGTGPTGITAATLLARSGVDCLVLDRWPGVYPPPAPCIWTTKSTVSCTDSASPRSCAAISRPTLGCGCSTNGSTSWPSSTTTPRPQRAWLPAGQHVRPARARGPAARQPEAIPERRIAGQRRGNRNQRRPRTPAGRVHRPLRRPNAPGRATAVSWAATAPTAWCAPRSAAVHAGFQLRAALAGRRYSHRTRTYISGRACIRCAIRFRAGTYMRIGEARYRWEFQLLAGESANDFGTLAALRPLITPWTADIADSELTLLRVTEYTFHATRRPVGVAATSSSSGTPRTSLPVEWGTGVGTGLRDAYEPRLGRSRGVRNGTLAASVLDNLQQEHKPHTRQLIRLALDVGQRDDRRWPLRRRDAPTRVAPAAPDSRFARQGRRLHDAGAA